jgi:hypothetical protein
MDMDSLYRDNFILRIYRRDEKDPENLVGQIEFIKSGEKIPFNGFYELYGILTNTPTETGARRR